jgi:hypothetical protein
MAEELAGTQILSDDPVPSEMTQALCGFLARYPGTWRVRVNQRLAGAWWSVTVSTEGFHRIFLLPPGEQGANDLMRQVREALGPAGPPGPIPPWDGRERRTRARR